MSFQRSNALADVTNHSCWQLYADLRARAILIHYPLCYDAAFAKKLAGVFATLLFFPVVLL